MPVLIEMRLKASWAVRPDTRQLHGLACTLFDDASDGHLRQEKPFSVWPLSPAPGEGGDEWAWQSAWLPDGPVPAAVTAADVLRVGHVMCAVTEIVQRQVTYARLAAGPATDSVTVSFGSPTYFS
jgi:hypothetical protein